MSATTPQRIAFNAPPQTPGLKGCTGIARLVLCIRCDRLYQAGDQMRPPAYRDDDRVYRCGSQVLDGVHVTSVPPTGGVDLSPSVGGGVVTTPLAAGVPA